MKLSDVRKMAIRQVTRVCFRLSDGQECVVDEHGIARVPGLKEAPAVNLEHEFSLATEFRLETVATATKKSTARTVNRTELAKLSSTQTADEPDDHDE